jgi:hypothetical protein
MQGDRRISWTPAGESGPPVDKNAKTRLTGPVSDGVFVKVNCFDQNPPAVVRGGFLR